jgi:hypothetical protein
MIRSTTNASIQHAPDVSLHPGTRNIIPMSLRTYTIERELVLPDGRQARIRLGLAQDSYIDRKDQETVVLELRIGDHVVAALNTLLDPEQEDEGAALVREVVAGLEEGRLEPTAEALDQYAERLP